MCRVFADSLLSRFCFFASVFFTLPFFSHFHFFLTLPISPSPPFPPTPHSRESGNLPVMPAEGGGFAPSALDREIPAFAGMGRGGLLGFFRVFADSLLSRFCFFASAFFTLTFFSHFHFFSHSPFRPHPHSPTLPIPAKAGISLCLPAEGGGFAPLALDREIPAFAGMGRGFCWFLCRVFADSLLSRFCFFASVFFTLPFFSHFHFFLTLPISPSPPFPPTPHSRESGNLPVMPAEGGGFAPLALG